MGDGVEIQVTREEENLPEDHGSQAFEIEVKTVKFGRKITVIKFNGAPLAPPDLKRLASRLKSALGVGGTVDGNTILLQGDHSHGPRYKRLVKIITEHLGQAQDTTMPPL